MSTDHAFQFEAGVVSCSCGTYRSSYRDVDEAIARTFWQRHVNSYGWSAKKADVRADRLVALTSAARAFLRDYDDGLIDDSAEARRDAAARFQRALRPADEDKRSAS